MQTSTARRIPMTKKRSTFYAVSRDEMNEFLFAQQFKLLNDPTAPIPIEFATTKELVYGRRISPKDRRMTLRVFSSIWLSGEARDKGSDAIRVCITWLDRQPYDEWRALPEDERGDVPVMPVIRGVGSTAHVKRIDTWRKNLRERILNFDSLLGPVCKCGRPTVERENKTTGKMFWGCVGYHDYGCKG
jgi:hypothetical protein